MLLEVAGAMCALMIQVLFTVLANCCENIYLFSLSILPRLLIILYAVTRFSSLFLHSKKKQTSLMQSLLIIEMLNPRQYLVKSGLQLLQCNHIL